MAEVSPLRGKFRVAEVSEFDARRGYRRCVPPGIGVCYSSGSKAVADFWRGRTGSVVVRIASLEYVYHLQASLADGSEIADQEMEEFSEYFAEVLLEWMVEGVDELPDACFDE